MFVFFYFLPVIMCFPFELPLTKILVKNNQKFVFGEFSKEFQDLFQEKYKENINCIPIYDSYYDKRNNNNFIESRYDHRLIDIYEILQPNDLKIIKIPTNLLDCFYISEYNRGERIWCNISKKYKDILLNCVNKKEFTYNMLEEFKIIKECEKYLKDNYIDFI